MELAAKLGAYQQKRRRLEDQLSDQQKSWHPLGQHFDRRVHEAAETQRRLQDCIQKKNVAMERHAELLTAIKEMPSRLSNLCNDNKRMEKEIQKVAAWVDFLRKDNEMKRCHLQANEEDVKKLSEMKKSLLMQLDRKPKRQPLPFLLPKRSE